MKFIKLALAAALAFGTISVASAPAAAQHNDRGEYRHDGNRHDARRDDHRRGAYRGNRGRHYGWRNNRGRHYGWRNNHNGRWAHRRVCRTVWRYGHRQRVCRSVRYRR